MTANGIWLSAFGRAASKRRRCRSRIGTRRKKEALQIKDWYKEIAPSAELRRWYGHDPAKWDEFQRRYRAELDANPDGWQPLLSAVHAGTVTLVYGAKDTERNSAAVLKAYLEARL
jgi:uncharacterized protein YeaO (DUF488 family)